MLGDIGDVDVRLIYMDVVWDFGLIFFVIVFEI